MPWHYNKDRVRVWDLYFDTELKIIHSHARCVDAKMAFKYKYIENIDLEDGDTEGAQALDKRGRACDRCKKYEAHMRGTKRDHETPPGFRSLAGVR